MNEPRQIPPGRRGFKEPRPDSRRTGGPAPSGGRPPENIDRHGPDWHRKAQPKRTGESSEAPPTCWLYLHGFGSSPRSSKAAFFKRKLDTAGLPLAIPDLNVPNFENMTISSILDEVDRTIAEAAPPDGDIGIIGSSLGGLVALHAAARNARIKRLMLLAPALSLFREQSLGVGRMGVKRWEKQGYFDVYRHAIGGKARIGVSFLVDAREYNEDELGLSIPIAIVHGEQDDLIDPRLSMEYARRNGNATLHMVDDEHDLALSIGQAWEILWRDIRPSGGKPREE